MSAFATGRHALERRQTTSCCRRHAVLDHTRNARTGSGGPGNDGLKVITTRLAHAVAHQTRARAVAPAGLVLVIHDLKILSVQYTNLAAHR